MQFIKNKTNYIAKGLLTSSLLILHGNMCTTRPQQPLPQKVPKPDRTYGSIMSSPEETKQAIQKLAELEDISKRLTSNTQAVQMLLSKVMSSKADSSPNGTHTDLYAEPLDHKKNENIDTDHTYYAQPEHIYEEITEYNINQGTGSESQTNINEKGKPTTAKPDHTYANIDHDKITSTTHINAKGEPSTWV